MEISEIIGLDVGSSRTGIARASSAARLAEPLKTVETKDLIEMLKDLAKTQKISAVVVGLPRSLNGKDTEQTAWVRQWAEKAKREVDAVFYWQDEALTSKLALARGGKEKTDLDALAAQIILQDFLGTPEDERTAC